MNGPRVLAFGAWDEGPGYPRASALLTALRQQGAPVHECRVRLPLAGAAKRRLVTSPWLWPGYLAELCAARVSARLMLLEAIRDFDPDVLLVPYPGHLAVRWARSLFRGPIVLDLFLSAYDTVVADRRMLRPWSPTAWFLKRLDRRACAAADKVLMDTAQQAEHVTRLVGCDPARMDFVPVSDPDQPRRALRYQEPQAGDRLEVLFFGTGIPLHGLGTLLEAVTRCANVRLTLVGGTSKDRRRAVRISQDKIRLLPRFISPARLREELDRCHLVAGVFGTTEKTSRVVPFKVVHALAAGRPVITANTPAVHELMRPGMDCLVVPPGDAGSLAYAFAELSNNPRRLRPLADAARHSYEQTFSLQRTGTRLVAILNELLGRTGEVPARDPVDVCS